MRLVDEKKEAKQKIIKTIVKLELFDEALFYFNNISIAKTEFFFIKSLYVVVFLFNVIILNNKKVLLF